MDRRQALAKGLSLPDRAEGAALFADISGFTALTEALARDLGPQRGAEELTYHLSQVYDALICELDRYGGSVIGFAGDAITCWLDGDDGLRAMACAVDMHRAMERFSSVAIPSGGTVSLGMKVAIAMGEACRFLSVTLQSRCAMCLPVPSSTGWRLLSMRPGAARSSSTPSSRNA